MSSSDRKFSREELAALMPWQLPNMGGRPVAEGAQPGSAGMERADAARLLTAEDIEAIQRQAYDEGRAEGYADGNVAGHAEGREAGYREGFEQGRDEGREEGRTTMQASAARFEELIGCLEEPLARMDEQVEEELVALAIAVGRQLIRRELKADPGQIVAVVRDAVAVLPSATRRIALYLHPEDAELVRSALNLGEAGPRWKIIEEPVMSRGGCRVATEISQVDATVERRLLAVVARLLGGERGEDQT